MSSDEIELLRIFIVLIPGLLWENKKSYDADL